MTPSSGRTPLLAHFTGWEVKDSQDQWPSRGRQLGRGVARCSPQIQNLLGQVPRHRILIGAWHHPLFLQGFWALALNCINFRGSFRMVHWRSTALLGGLSNLEHVEGWSKAGSLELCWKESLDPADMEQWWTGGTQLQVLKEFKEELGRQREFHEGLRNISWCGCRVSSRWEKKGWGGNPRPFHSECPVSTGRPIPSVLSYCLGSRPSVCTWLCPAVGLCGLLFPSAPWPAGGCRAGGERDLLLPVCHFCWHPWAPWLAPASAASYTPEPDSWCSADVSAPARQHPFLHPPSLQLLMANKQP